MADLPTATITGATTAPPLKKIRMAPTTRAFQSDIAALLKKHSLKTKPDSLLAAAAHLVGVAIALQDPKTMTIDDAFDIIRVNIANGNVAARAKLNSAANL